MSDVAKGALAYCFFIGIIACEMGVCQSKHMSIAWYFLPFVPIVRFVSSALRFPGAMATGLDEGEIGQEGPRAVHLTLAGFSFAAFLVLVIEAIKPETKVDLSLSVYYTFVSLVAFSGGFLLDSYSFTRWMDEARACLIEIGRLALLASSIALLWLTVFAIELKLAISGFAAAGWLLNFFFHWYVSWRFFAAKPLPLILQGRAAAKGRSR